MIVHPQGGITIQLDTARDLPWFLALREFWEFRMDMWPPTDDGQLQMAVCYNGSQESLVRLLKMIRRAGGIVLPCSNSYLEDIRNEPDHDERELIDIDLA